MGTIFDEADQFDKELREKSNRLDNILFGERKENPSDEPAEEPEEEPEDDEDDDDDEDDEIEED